MSDRGSGTVLAIALIGCIVAVFLAVLPVYQALAVRRSVVAAADAAALAAADVAVGIVPGYPCAVAAVVAQANHASLTSCTADGLVMTVVASRVLFGFSVTAVATAGPAPD